MEELNSSFKKESFSQNEKLSSKENKERESEKSVAELFGPLTESTISEISLEKINKDPTFRNLAEAF